MIKDVLENIGGVGVYGVISILIFFSTFVGVLIWVFTLRKSDLKEASEIPLRDEPGVPTMDDANLDKDKNHD